MENLSPYVRMFFIFLALLLTGCITSATDWRKTPKVFIQVCVVSNSSHQAEIVYYRPDNLGIWTATPAAKTSADQDVYNGFFEDPTPSNTAYAVHILGGDSVQKSSYYIFLMNSKVTPEWSAWKLPDAVESSFPKRIERFDKFHSVDRNLLMNAPRMRFRTEMLKDYDRTRLSGERYQNMQGCI